jgi:hypothetical protein
MVKPIEVQILPSGRGLGFEAERINRKRKRRERKGNDLSDSGKRLKSDGSHESVFNFLNATLHGGGSSINGRKSVAELPACYTPKTTQSGKGHRNVKGKGKERVMESTIKQNVELISLSKKISGVEKEISKVKETLARNRTNKAIVVSCESRIAELEKAVAGYRSREVQLTSKMKQSRDKSKLSSF